MQLRRRWSAIPLVALATFLSLANARLSLADSPYDKPAEKAAKDLTTAKGVDAVKIRNDVVAAKPADIVELSKYVGAFADQFKAQGLLSDKNPDGQLNAAIAMAQLQSIAADHYLEEMLTTSNAGVRYWGAKGLGDIAPRIKTFAGAALTNSTTALNAALAKETSGIVKKEIFSTLIKLGDSDAIIGAAGILAASLQSKFPDVDTLTVTTTVLEQLKKLADGTPALSPDQKAQAAQAAAWTASLAVQQERAAAKADLPKDYHASVGKVVDGAIAALNSLAGSAGKKFSEPLGSKSADEMQLLLDGLVGSTSMGGGALQKILPDVKVPPQVKK